MTMTMDHDTIIVSTAMAQPGVLASINSMTVFCSSKNDITPMLENIQLTRSGYTQLTAVATNRFVAIKAVYDNVEFADWNEDKSMLVPIDTLKQAATISKAKRGLAMATFAVDTENMSYVSVGDTRFKYRQDTGSYPPVARLFPDTEPNGAATLGINPKWLAALSKIVVPETRPKKDAPWQLAFWSEDSAKPKPMQATMAGDGYDIRVLIQPNLIVR